MKKYIKPILVVVSIQQTTQLLAGSQDIQDGPSVYETEHGGGASWSRSGSFWDDDEE